jgi:LytR cell envelope-related transcriptional attenuator
VTAPTDLDRERVLRRRHKRERQAVVFGLLIAALAVGALGAVAVFTGGIESPFSRPFTTRAPEADEVVAPPPCPPDGTLPVPYAQVQVTVLNATTRAGLAGQTAESLTARGFAVLGTGNSPSSVPGTARISFGPAGVGPAYTLAAHLEGVRLVLDSRADATVDLAVGSEFVSLLDPGIVPLAPDAPLVGQEGCVPLEQAAVGTEPAATDPAPEQPAG